MGAVQPGREPAPRGPSPHPTLPRKGGGLSGEICDGKNRRPRESGDPGGAFANRGICTIARREEDGSPLSRGRQAVSISVPLAAHRSIAHREFARIRTNFPGQPRNDWSKVRWARPCLRVSIEWCNRCNRHPSRRDGLDARGGYAASGCNLGGKEGCSIAQLGPGGSQARAPPRPRALP